MSGPERLNVTLARTRASGAGGDDAGLAAKSREAVRRLGLDLRGTVVLTEAATGAYAVTPALAALAGADRVFAQAGTSSDGGIELARGETLGLARRLGVLDRIEIVTERSPTVVGRADIVTNSGHVRPLDAALVGWMKPSAVVPLMYEAWELRAADVDVAACERRGVAVAGTNERHPAVNVFAYLGAMAVTLLADAGLELRGAHVLVLCDNEFGPFLREGLAAAHAAAELAPELLAARSHAPYDAILVALRPRTGSVLSAVDVDVIRLAWPGATVAQMWGDLDRRALGAAGLRVWPRVVPEPGHMGILPSAIGPEPVVRLQSAGLKVGEILCRARRAGRSVAQSLDELARTGYGTLL